MMRILATIALVLGGFVATCNWYSIYASWRSKRFVSVVPLVGAFLLVLGLFGFENTKPYAWLGVFLDYGTIVLILAIPALAKDFWDTSSANMIHRFIRDQDGQHLEIRLFKNSIFTILYKYDPSVSRIDGSAIISFGCRGEWIIDESGFRLSNYSKDRILEIREVNGRYVTKETNYPFDKAFCLDSLELKKQK